MLNFKFLSKCKELIQFKKHIFMCSQWHEMWGSSSFQKKHFTEMSAITGRQTSINKQAKLKGLSGKIVHSTRMDLNKNKSNENYTETGK